LNIYRIRPECKKNFLQRDPAHIFTGQNSVFCDTDHPVSGPAWLPLPAILPGAVTPSPYTRQPRKPGGARSPGDRHPSQDTPPGKKALQINDIPKIEVFQGGILSD